MNLINFRNRVREKAIQVGLSYTEIEGLTDVNEILNQQMPCLMFNYEQETNDFSDPNTILTPRIYLITNDHDATRTETGEYERDWIITTKNTLRNFYINWLKLMPFDGEVFLQLNRDTQLQLQTRVSVEGFLIMEALPEFSVSREFCLNDNEPYPPTCDPVTLTLNGSGFLTLASGANENITLVDEDGDPVAPISVSGAEITLPSGGVCAPVTYNVEYADGTPIESGREPSGGDIQVVVPNCQQPSGIAYCEPNCGTTQFTTFADYDEGWRGANNELRVVNPTYPLYYQRLDFTAVNPLITLENNNVFGNKNRYTGTSGENTPTAVTGGVLVADHLTKRMYYIETLSLINWTQFINHGIGSNIGGYGDFYGLTQKEFFYLQDNSNELIQIMGLDISTGFNVSGTWTCTTARTSTNQAFSINNTNYPIGRVSKTSVRGGTIWTRIFDDTTVVGGVGTLS